MNDGHTRGLVSIGFPVFNGAAHMRPALESLLNQTYHNTEIIISDNASTDDTERVCREYAARDPRIRYIRQKNNIASVPNAEFLMHEARGEYFVLGADDDWWHPEFIEKLKTILDSRPEYGVAIGSVRRVYPSGEIRNDVIYRDELNLTNQTFAQVFYKMSSEWPVHWFCGVFRTKLLVDLLQMPWPECKAQDRVFMCELALVSHIYSIPEILHHKTVYRQSNAERLIHDPIANRYKDPRRHSKYVWAVVSRLIRSRNIPFWRKVGIYPCHLTAFLWRNRVFVREWFPRSFALALKVKSVLKNPNGKRV